MSAGRLPRRRGAFASPSRSCRTNSRTFRRSQCSSVTLAYGFDFGDEGWHRIKAAEIGNSLPKARFPRVTQRIGESPPQYPDFDEGEGEL